jgi:hypothetical protein
MNSSQRKLQSSSSSSSQKIAGSTPSITRNLSVVPRRMSFAPDVQQSSADDVSITFARAQQLGQVATASVKQPLSSLELLPPRAVEEEDAEDKQEQLARQQLVAQKQQQFATIGHSESDAKSHAQPTPNVDAFMKICALNHPKQVKASRQSSANGFVQRDGHDVELSQRAALFRAVFENTESEIAGEACQRYEQNIEILRSNIEDAEQYFEEQQPPVMQMVCEFSFQLCTTCLSLGNSLSGCEL